MQNATGIKGVVLKINITFVALLFLSFLVLCLSLFHVYSNGNTASFLKCTCQKCKVSPIMPKKGRAPSFLDFINASTKIGLINMEEDDLRDWGIKANSTTIQFERVSSSIAWQDLFPQWDNEDSTKSLLCRIIPMPDFTVYNELDIVMAWLPCRKPEDGWNRDVFRLQVHMVSVNLAVRKGKRDPNRTVKVIFLSKCIPMMDFFRCDDLVRNEGEWWMYEANISKLEDKLRLPFGSCNIALPIWAEGIINKLSTSKQTSLLPGRQEAYATVLHSSDKYVCGAIMLAHSIRRSGSRRDLILLHDESVPEDKLRALATVGWSLRKITRIRNPQGEHGSYNEYNFSKFRLWQLTEYDKIIAMDADVLVLRNLDLLFSLPQMSAGNNHKFLFNSGVMVIEPSNCTFNVLVQNKDNMTSYNGGDQGFLNEHFVSWHQLPRRINYLKYFHDIHNDERRKFEEELFGAEVPPKLYSIHYLGRKPWTCSRDHDCNWDREHMRRFASDAANQKWWKFHDELDESIQVYCQPPVPKPEMRKMKLL